MGTITDTGPRLTPADRAEMLARALAACPDIFDDDLIVIHLKRLGISIVSVSDILLAAIDEARANRKRGPT